MVHAETDSLLQILKQGQRMDELLKQVKPDSGLTVSHALRIYAIKRLSQARGPI